MAKYVDIEPVFKRLTAVCVTDDCFGMGVQTGVNHAIEIIAEAPIVDAVEVVHGHMEEIEPCQITIDRQCCLCGTPMGKCDNYCPNCGAKMDGGNEDGK